MSNPEVDQPKLVSHCAILFSKMDSEANEDRVWTGKIIEASRLVGINVGSYSRVVNALRKLGCIEQIEKGYRSRPSMYRIHYPPTSEVWEKFAPDRTEDLTSGPSSDTMAAAIKDLQKQLGGINVVEAMKNHEERIEGLRKELAAIRQEFERTTTAREQ